MRYINKVKDIGELCMNIPLYFFSGFFRKNNKRICLGSWNGENYCDNTKYLFQYLSKETDYEVKWIGKEKTYPQIEKELQVKFIKYGSLKSIYYILTSKFIFISHDYKDIFYFNILKNSIITNLWHGAMIKKILADGNRKNEDRTKINILYNEIKKRTIWKTNYIATSSKENKIIAQSAFRYFQDNEINFLEIGTPRIEYLIKLTQKEKANFQKYILEKVGIKEEKKIILYMPTFRDNTKEVFSFNNIADTVLQDKLNCILEKNNYIILQKVHMRNRQKENEIKDTIVSKNIHKVEEDWELDSQQLLASADILITDYSSCFVDYLVMNKPIIHYVYDYEEYRDRDRGVYYSLEDFKAGNVAYEINQLLELIEGEIEGHRSTVELRENAMNRFLNYQEKNCMEEIKKRIIESKIGTNL